MDFASPQETALAMVAMVRYLPALIRAFETGVEGLGLTITERVLGRDAEGTALPTLVVSGKHLTYRLGLRNAVEDFLAVDREARPVHVDPRLDDDTYARAKIADIVSGRLALVKLIEESRDLAQAQERLKGFAGRFAWIRSAVVDAPTEACAPTRKPPCKLVGTERERVRRHRSRPRGPGQRRPTRTAPRSSQSVRSAPDPTTRSCGCA